MWNIAEVFYDLKTEKYIINAKHWTNSIWKFDYIELYGITFLYNNYAHIIIYTGYSNYFTVRE